MVNYKTKLRANELQVIENISYNENTQLTLQSIYSYMVKHTTLQGGFFTKSLPQLYKMYSKYHNKISLNWFKKMLKRLVDFKMIIIDKTYNTNTYLVNRDVKFYSPITLNVTENVTENVTDEKISESVDMTELQEDSENPNYNYKLNNTITIIDNTVSETVADNEVEKSLAYEKAIEENNKGLAEPSELIELAISKLKEQGRRSKKIIARLETKLAKRNNINRKSMDKYLDVVVADAIAFYETGREKMALLIATKKAKYNSAYNLKKNKSTVATANFTQRKYDYDKLEAQLLGWDTSDDDDYEIGAIESTVAPTTANFTQRKYDYDKLEAQLLGWDTSDDDCEIDVAEPTNMPITANFTQRQYDYDKLELQLLGWADSDSDSDDE